MSNRFVFLLCLLETKRIASKEDLANKRVSHFQLFLMNY